MNCEQFDIARVGDDPHDRLDAERHAGNCPRCAEQLRLDQVLDERVEAYRRASSSPPPSLEARIAAACARPAAPPSRWSRARFGAAAAAAAVLLLLSGLAYRHLQVPRPPPTLGALIDQIERSERDHMRAVAELQRRTEEVLARADDPALPASQAAILLAYRDRLAHLDAVVAEVRAFLDQNPGHAGGHTALMAAYREKTRVMQEILERPKGASS